jgi:hypothetical protein
VPRARRKQLVPHERHGCVASKHSSAQQPQVAYQPRGRRTCRSSQHRLPRTFAPNICGSRRRRRELGRPRTPTNISALFRETIVSEVR